MFPCCSSSLRQIQISRGSWLGNQNEKRKEGCRFFDIPARRRWISLSIKEHRRKKTNTVCSAVSFWKLGRTKLQNKCPFPFPAPRAEGSLENCLFLAQAGIHDLFIVPEMSGICLTSQSNVKTSWMLHGSFLQAWATQVSDSRPTHTAISDRRLLLFRITGGGVEGREMEEEIMNTYAYSMNSVCFHVS